jgi:hypothetical protein
MEQHEFKRSGNFCIQKLDDSVCGLEANHPIHRGSIRSLSLGEQLHDPVFCAKRGRPHLGSCIDPVYQRLLVSKVLETCHLQGYLDLYSAKDVDTVTKRIVNTLNEYQFGED